MSRDVLSLSASMQTSNFQDVTALVEGMSPDVPFNQRFFFWLAAFLLHGGIFLLLFVSVEGEGFNQVSQPATQDVAFYVETVIPVEIEIEEVVEEAVEPEPEPVIEEEEILEEVREPEEALVIEQVKKEKPEPKARISPVVLTTKPKPPVVKKKNVATKTLQVVAHVPKKQSSVSQRQTSQFGFIKPSFPAYLRNPPPTYPKIAKRRRMEGVTRLWVRISATGQVLDLKIQQSSGHVRLDQEAVKTVRKWRFIPAKKQGRAVMGEVIVPIRFQLKKN